MHDGSLRARHPRRAVAAALVALTLATAACGGDDDDATTDATEQSGGDDATTDATEQSGDDTTEQSGGGADATLDVSDFSFDDLTAPAGGTVEIVNGSGASHTVTADDGAFDEPLGADDTIELPVPAEPGEHPFHCEIHPDMTATLTAE